MILGLMCVGSSYVAAWDILGVLLWIFSMAMTTPHHMQRGGCLQWTQMWPKRWQL
jgi:hypothetical protein